MEAAFRIAVCCIDTALRGAEEMKRDQDLLNSDELSHMIKLRNRADRRDYAAAHALLRQMLSAASPGITAREWRFLRDAGGKPMLPPELSLSGSLSFSISHTRNFVACAVCCGSEVGVDVELDTATIDVDELARVACSASERNQIESVPPPSRLGYFLDLWTLKEAYLKACGIGITEDGLAETCFDLREPALIVTSLAGRSRRAWTFSLLSPVPGSRIAVAVALPPGAPPQRPLMNVMLCGAGGVRTPLRPVRIGFHSGG